MRLIIDRITDGIAVLEKEDMTHIEIEASLLPDGVKEGTVLDFDGINYVVNSEAEAEIRERIIKKQRSIFKKRS